ncbi:hypothetical protein FRB99_008387, partial [Tulasnella sp. 403]
MSTFVPPQIVKRKEPCPACQRVARVCDGMFPDCDNYRRAPSYRSSRNDQRPHPPSYYLERRLEQLQAKLDRLKEEASRPPPRMSFASQIQPISQYGERPPEMSGKWWEPAELARPVRDYLLNICFMLRHRHLFYFHIPTFFASLASNDPAKQPHRAMLEAIYLIACSFTDHLPPDDPHSLVKHEAHFLDRARKALADCLAYTDHFLDYLKASDLVASYLYTRGRFLEGYHQQCGATRLAISCGLHRIKTPIYDSNTILTQSPRTVLLEPPKSQVELTDRIMTWWKIYLWDKIGVIFTGFVSAVNEGPDDIVTPLPRPIEEYEQNDLRQSDCETIQMTLTGTPHPHRRPDSPFALLIKSLVLYSRTKMLYTFGPPGKLMEDNPDCLPQARHSIQRFVDSFSRSYPLTPEEIDQIPHFDPRFAAYTLALGAKAEIMTISETYCPVEYPDSYAEKIGACKMIASLIPGLPERGSIRGCVIYGVSWCIAAETLIHHMHKLETSFPVDLEQVMTTRTEVQVILSALELHSHQFPIFAQQVVRMRAMLGGSSAAQMNALAVDNARDNNSLDSDAPEADTIPDPHNIVLEDKLLAIGGRADVFRATWTKDGNPNDKIQVAVKILRLSGMSRDVPDDYDAQLAKLDQRLGRESFTWKNLKHDHITPFLGYLKSRNDVIPGDNPILVSPYYANGNLVNYLRSNPNADVFALLEQAAEGLLYLHTRKPRVAHLDIKGENILINDDHKASLCDFGIARILDNIASGFYTTTNQAMTLPFASPEMQLGKRVDTAADVYSFAGLILQALSGIHPYWEIRAAPAMITLNICMG